MVLISCTGVQCCQKSWYRIIDSWLLIDWYSINNDSDMINILQFLTYLSG